jgi:hypothetical protein
MHIPPFMLSTEWVGEFWYIAKKPNLSDNCAAQDFMSKGMNSLSQVSLLGGEKNCLKWIFFGPTKCFSTIHGILSLDLQHLLPPPPQLFSSSDMRVNFPSSSDSMQILKAGVASPRFVGKSGFYHFLSCADRYRLVVTNNTYPLFVCLFVTTCCWRMRRGYVVLKLIAHLFCSQDK